MLLLNGKEWSGWQDILGKNFGKGHKGSWKFYLTERYQGARKVNNQWIKTYPPDLALPSSYHTMIDGKLCQVQYVVNTAGGKIREGHELATMPNEIVFVNGMREVQADELELYFWLSRHPRNETNPAYFKRGEKGRMVVDEAKQLQALKKLNHFMFRERDEELEQELHYDKQAAVINATSFIVNNMTEKEAREMYRLYGEPDWTEDALPKIKNYLISKAQDDPKAFNEELNSDVRTIKTVVLAAKAAELIVFKVAKRQWVWGDSGAVIISVARGKEEINELVQHLKNKDDGEIIKSLEKSLEEIDAKAGVE